MHRRRGAGPTDAQVRRTLAYRVHVPDRLQHLGRGELRILHGPLGSGKSDIAEEWFRSNIAAARTDSAAAIPLWITIDDLTTALEPHILTEVGLPALSRHGVDVIDGLDGLDERTNKAAALMRQAGEFVKMTGIADPADHTQPRARQRRRPHPDPTSDSTAGGPAHGGRRRRHHRRPGATAPNGRYSTTFRAAGRPAHTAAEGATGMPEIIDRVVADVVSCEKYNLFSELRALAVETIRTGSAIDPASSTAADTAAMIRASPLVVTTGRKCAFALATFEQWFAVHAILDNIVGTDEVLATMDMFNRWRYVLIVAGHDVVDVDTG